MTAKTLKFFKLLSTISIDILGVFVPGIIYLELLPIIGETAICFAVGYLVARSILRVVLNLLLKKAMFNHQYYFVCLKIVFAILFFVSMLLIDVNIFLGASLALIFNSLVKVCNAVPENIVFAQLKKKVDTDYGRIKIYENLGIIIASVVGGLLLDRVDQIVIILIALGLYLIGAIPLLKQNFMQLKKQIKDNAVNPVAVDSTLTDQTEQVKKIKKSYFLFYIITVACFAPTDYIYQIFNIYVFKNTLSFANMGYISALCVLGMMVFNFFFMYIKNRKTRVFMSSLSLMVLSVCPIALIFLNSSISLAIIFFVIGTLYSIMNIFSMEVSMEFTKLYHCRKELVFIREVAADSGQTLTMIFAMFGTVTPFLIAVSGVLLFGGIYNQIMCNKYYLNKQKSEK